MSVTPGPVELSLVIPAYNEEARIGPTIEKLARFLAGQPLGWEILVVDDGSTDGTVALCAGIAERLPGLRVIATSPNRGKGHAVRVGMLEARGGLRVMCDADGSTPAGELPRLLAPLLAGDVDVAIGSRYAGGSTPNTQPAWRRAWSRVCNFFVQRTLVPGVRDTQCGFKAFTAAAAIDLFRRATIDGWAFDLEILALARRLGYVVVEIGVDWLDDRRSRVNPLVDFWKVVGEALTIRRNFARGAYGRLSPSSSGF
jgi:dolichyl-phosphate beta-glucosyltransferase